MNNRSEEYLKLKDGKMLCISFGRGERTLVMIPGLRLSGIEGSSGVLAWYYRIFAKEYRVYVFDRKEPADDGCTIHGMAEDLAEAMDLLGISDACVFGASMGGMIAQDLAISHPGLVSRLVLGVTLSRPNDTLREVIGHWTELADKGDLTAIAEDYMHLGFSEAYLRKYKAFIPLAIRTQKMMPKERFISLAKACLTCSTYDDLSSITCPVLVLGGGKDRIVTGEASLEIAEKLGCRCHIYENLSHEAYNEAKDFNKRIYEFFKEYN